MARIELRHTKIRLVDGYSNTAAVDDSPAENDDVVEIDTLGNPGAIPVSSRFTVVGSDDQYTVIGTEETDAVLVVSIGTHNDGTFTVTVDGETTSALDHDETLNNVEGALELLDSVGVGNVSVSGTPGTEYTITLAGDLAGKAVVMSADTSSLTGGSGAGAVQTEDGGDTFEIEFTPPFKSGHVPSDDAVITFTGRTVEVKVGDGNFTYAENREYNYDLNRGNLDTVREGDQQPMDWSLDLTWEELTALPGTTTPSVEDAFKRRGAASDWESSSSDPCEPYCVDIEVEVNKPCGNQPYQIVTIPMARPETFDHDMDAATISASGRSNATNAIITHRVKVA